MVFTESMLFKKRHSRGDKKQLRLTLEQVESRQLLAAVAEGELWANFTTNSSWQSHVVGDFDGDGLDDMASFRPADGTTWVSRSTGEDFNTSLWADFVTNSGWQSHIVGDFDGDGLDDMASFHPDNGRTWVSRSTGTDFETALWADFVTDSGWQSHIVGDFDGNGLDDIASFHPDNGRTWVSRSTGTKARSVVRLPAAEARWSFVTANCPETPPGLAAPWTSREACISLTVQSAEMQRWNRAAP